MREFYDAFLTGGILLCAVMIPIWLVRISRKGTTAYLMAGAFAVMGALLALVKFEAPRGYVIFAAICLALLLGADVAVRSAARYRQEVEGGLESAERNTQELPDA